MIELSNGDGGAHERNMQRQPGTLTLSEGDGRRAGRRLCRTNPVAV